ncbi:SGNH/GDSL hydrolase family protein [Bdellovibrio svalbardensis]|uniref:SGNH/GDSL hydrolase family protein n=1 Tax=Bdellovibrio svalbardensis TaxID=2972972 RepID=A0ABT6DFH6_9BACT|nr:SGNH/GDSL hydrolase family protein [Bdellovibrio svalbardensis]MDG0815222.1 SGNH/GDSL hydrolase family protein [Bdellovibrio svalbardensis]
MKYSALIIFFISSAVFANVETLIIGDSHVVGPFGENMHKIFRTKTKEDTRTLGLAGASPSNFVAANAKQRTLSYGFADRNNENERLIKGGTAAELPELGPLLAKTNPNRIVIELGDNFADYRNPSANSDASAKKQVQLIISELEKQNSKATCYWVTPTWTDKSGSKPYQKTNERLVKLIDIIKKTASPRCTVIDSANGIGLQQSDIKTGSDGLHFDGTNGKKWAEAAANKIFEIEKAKQSGTKSAPADKTSSAIK